ncbi:MAG: hypothetical protein ACREDQ_02760, partial [Limisphaerales bacterium]
MERKPKTLLCSCHRLIGTVFSAGAALVLAASAPAQDLFASIFSPSGSIVEITPGGVQIIFASGLPYPTAVAFDSAGNLYLAVVGNTFPQESGTVIKITPGGSQSVI